MVSKKHSEESLEYARRTYGVPAYLGTRVRYAGKLGKVVGGDGAYVVLLLDGESKPSGRYHPTSDIEYLQDKTNALATAAAAVLLVGVFVLLGATVDAEAASTTVAYATESGDLYPEDGRVDLQVATDGTVYWDATRSAADTLRLTPSAGPLTVTVEYDFATACCPDAARSGSKTMTMDVVLGSATVPIPLEDGWSVDVTIQGTLRATNHEDRPAATWTDWTTRNLTQDENSRPKADTSYEVRVSATVRHASGAKWTSPSVRLNDASGDPPFVVPPPPPAAHVVMTEPSPSAPPDVGPLPSDSPPVTATPAVPSPGTGWVVGVGLAVAMFVRRRRST